MTTRDARGRFTNADHAAAERVIEAAVREAVRLLRRGLYGDRGARRVEADHRHMATVVLEHAAHAAGPLLAGGAS
jgi:hypothetical protein